MTDSSKKEPSKQELFKVYLKEGCMMNDEDFRTHFYSDRPVKVFTEADSGFTGDNRYDTPVGWCYAKVKHAPADPKVDGSSDWCYYGSQAKNVMPILKNRRVIPGNRKPGSSIGDLHHSSTDIINNDPHTYTSPCIYYASHYAYALPDKWEYKGKTYYVRVVFMTKQKKDTYRVERMSLVSSCWDPNVAFDNSFKNEEIEWVTEEPESIAIEYLLIHFSDTPVEDLVKEREKSRRGIHVEVPMEGERDKLQENFKANRLMILWVDDHPENNTELVQIIRDCGVMCVCRPDTDSALRELREHGSGFFAVFTDLVRTEKRAGDASEKPYYKAGIDLVNSMRDMAICLPVYMYSSWCRLHQELCTEALEAGISKICTYNDIVYLIRRE